MELPAALRHAVDQALEGVALADLARAADLLSQRYRAEIRDDRFHLSDDLAALAYLTTRLPATYAAIRAALAMVTERLSDFASPFAPASQLDLGAGPGTAFWAARDCWPEITTATLLEGSDAIRRQGEKLIGLALPRETGPGETGPGKTESSETGDIPISITWQSADLAKLDAQGAAAMHQPADLVSLCYVLDELAPAARQRLVDWAWAHCDGMLVIVEPGTPAGWHRILTARQHLLAQGARIIAPCPHELVCPLLPATQPATAERGIQGEYGAKAAVDVTGPWCHFSRRVARSRLHRLAKQADVPWEDEKFIFIAVMRPSIPVSSNVQATQAAARLIAPPRGASGRLQLQLCEADGQKRDRLISKRDGDLYRRARRLGWGDSLDLATE
jgi:ribosomal protein RSM22 (predicted rRNA methylase)